MNAPRLRPSLLPSPLRPLRGRNNAFTMIELVASLALFVVIFGILLIALNAATALWQNSHAQRSERPSAENIADLIADDLYQAVVANTNDYPIFSLETPPSPTTLTEVYTVLSLVRPASFHTPLPVSDQRRAIDAIFYTYYGNALFRHVIPIVTSGFQDPESIGKIMDDYKKGNLTPANHDKIIAYLEGLGSAPTDLTWEWQLLANRMTIMLNATIPRSLIRRDNATRYPNVLPSVSDPDHALLLPPLPVDKLYADVLPDQVDVVLRLFNQQDWDAYEPLRNLDTTTAIYQKNLLGTLLFRRITLPQTGGSRLP